MAFTRTQVNAAKAALGLDVDDTRSISIYPDTVFTEIVARDDDGVPAIRDGLVGYHQVSHQIEEVDDDGSAA